MGNEPERLLTADEVKDRLRLSKATVWKLVAAGELRSMKIGHSRRVPESAVSEFIRRGVDDNDRQLNAGAPVVTSPGEAGALTLDVATDVSPASNRRHTGAESVRSRGLPATAPSHGAR